MRSHTLGTRDATSTKRWESIFSTSWGFRYVNEDKKKTLISITPQLTDFSNSLLIGQGRPRSCKRVATKMIFFAEGNFYSLLLTRQKNLNDYDSVGSKISETCVVCNPFEICELCRYNKLSVLETGKEIREQGSRGVVTVKKTKRSKQTAPLGAVGFFASSHIFSTA